MAHLTLRLIEPNYLRWLNSSSNLYYTIPLGFIQYREGVFGMGRKSSSNALSLTYGRLQHHSFFRILLFLLGLPVHIITFLLFYLKKQKDPSSSLNSDLKSSLVARGIKEELYEEFKEQYERKHAFFNEKMQINVNVYK